MEPIEDTLKAIDYITGAGAFPDVCVLRPASGMEMEDYPSLRYKEMVIVFHRMHESLVRNNMPIVIAHNIHVSLVVQPTEGRYFIEQKKSELLQVSMHAIPVKDDLPFHSSA